MTSHRTSPPSSTREPRSQEDVARHVAATDRLHHLDALRAFAMLLGVVLHASLAYLPGDWPVRDAEEIGGLGIVAALIHGFRMPLFFMLSGYFTAMIRSRRGIGGMVRQRARRIALPLLVGTFTIVPVTWAAILGCRVDQRAQALDAGVGPAGALAAASRRAELDGVRALLDAGVDPNAVIPGRPMPALAIAAMHGHLELSRLLLERGADLGRLDGDGNGALHFAALFGHAEVARMLLDAGADPDAANVRGERPADFARAGRSPTAFVAAILGVSVDVEAVESGRLEVLRVLEASRASDAPRALAPIDESEPRPEPRPRPRPEPPAVREGDVGSGRETPDPPVPTRVAPSDGSDARDQAASPIVSRAVAVVGALQRFPFFHHLWFLWYLCWIIAGYAIVAWLGERAAVVGGRVRVPRSLRAGPLALLWQVPLVMLAMAPMQSWGATPGFGPDTGTGIIPLGSSIAFYAIFFAAGVLAFDARCRCFEGTASRRMTTLLLMAAVVVALPALALAFGMPGARAFAPDEGVRRLLSLAGQALFAWTTCLGLIALSARLLGRERPRTRRLADASFWIYLAHLPLVIALQAMLVGLAIPALLKFAIVIVAALVILLLSDAWLVRGRWIGRILLGEPRRPEPERGGSARLADERSPGPPPPPPPG